MISVIIVNYNYAQFLPVAIESVLNQEYKPSEILILDDGSSDASLEIIQKYQKEYPDLIRLIQHNGGNNRGIQETYRLGIEAAKEPWIAFLEADDYWREDKLEKCYAVIREHSEVGLIFSDFKAVGYRRGCFYWELYSIKNRQNLPHYEPFDLFSGMLTRNALTSFSHTLVRKELLFNVPKMKCMQMNFDWWLLGHAAAHTQAYFFNEKMSYWRIHKNSYGYRSMNFFLLKRLHVFLVKYLNALLVLKPVCQNEEKVQIIKAHLYFLDKIKRGDSLYLLRKIIRHPFAFLNFLMFVLLKKILF